MPRQANGQYQQPANTAAVSGATISSAADNTLITDIGTELTNSLDRQGRSSMSAALPMGGNKITGMADPVASTDGATKNYTDTATALLVSKVAYQNAAQISAVAAGSSDTITAAFTPTITALSAGMTLEVRAGAANSTPTPTFQADSTTAKTIVKGAGFALVAGDIAGAGHWLSLTYDLTLDKWVLNNPANAAKFSFPVPAAFKNLSIKVATNTTVNVAADFVTTTDGVSYQTTAVSATINLGTAGVANALDAGTIAIDTWYAIWVIAQPGGTTACLASTSFTSPTLPTGYTYKARIGAVRTIHASATLFGTWQLGRRAQYVVGLTQTTSFVQLSPNGSTGTVSSANSMSAVSVSGVVPTTASEINFVLSVQTGSTIAICGPNNNFGAYNSLTNPPPFSFSSTSIAGGNVSGSLLLESSNIYFASTGASNSVFCSGWTDNI